MTAWIDWSTSLDSSISVGIVLGCATRVAYQIRASFRTAQELKHIQLARPAGLPAEAEELC